MDPDSEDIRSEGWQTSFQQSDDLGILAQMGQDLFLISWYLHCTIICICRIHVMTAQHAKCHIKPRNMLYCSLSELPVLGIHSLDDWYLRTSQNSQPYMWLNEFLTRNINSKCDISKLYYKCSHIRTRFFNSSKMYLSPFLHKKAVWFYESDPFFPLWRYGPYPQLIILQPDIFFYCPWPLKSLVGLNNIWICEQSQ